MSDKNDKDTRGDITKSDLLKGADETMKKILSEYRAAEKKRTGNEPKDVIDYDGDDR